MTTSGPPVFPFIVGCERSGTTLLRLMIDAHPDIAIPSESYFVTQLYLSRRPFREQVPFPAARFAEELLRHRWFMRWELPADEVRAALVRDPPNDYAEAVRRVFALFAASVGKPRYGDKTPVYVLNLPLLASRFPEARFIHIIRDGRDVALSLRDTRFGPDSVSRGAIWWRRRVQEGRAAGSLIGPERYREVRYEDLIGDPEAILRGICDFVALPYDDRMLAPHEHAPTVIAPGSFRLHPHLLEPPRADVRDWRTQMAPQDVVAFEVLAGDALRDLGYERSGLRPTAEAHLRAWGVRVDASLRRRAHRIGTSRVAGAARRLPQFAGIGAGRTGGDT